MDPTKVLEQLEGVAEQLGVKIRYDVIEGDAAFSYGGMCRIRGMPLIIVNKTAPLEDQVQILVKALCRLDTSRIYLMPRIRDLIEQWGS